MQWSRGGRSMCSQSSGSSATSLAPAARPARPTCARRGSSEPDAIVFAPNTHQLLVSLFAAVSSNWPIAVLTSDGEFHSARRQFARWEEAGAAMVQRIPVEPFDSFSDRFLDAARAGGHDF